MINGINPELKSKAKNIKAMFFDIDGTLLSNKTNKIPQSTMEALNRAARNGVLLFVATGRHKQQIEGIEGLSDIKFTGYVTLNGQYCYERGNVVYKNPINPGDVKRMAEYVQRTSTPCLFLESDRLYVNIVDEYVRKEHEAILSSVPQVRDISRVYEREILQMGMYLQDDSIPEILNDMQGCTYTRWKTCGIDIIARGGSKWTGMEQMMKCFGLTFEQVMSFGDSDNDLEMLLHSGISVAMGNAGDNVKAVSDHVTDGVDEDGIYNAMQGCFSWM